MRTGLLPAAEPMRVESCLQCEFHEAYLLAGISDPGVPKAPFKVQVSFEAV